MFKTKIAVVAFALMLLPAASASAQTRTWVSGVGDDVNPCSRTAPCKTFPGAISKTAAAGEISVLDPGSYGIITIMKSISLVADGNEGAIMAGSTVTGLNGITVNAGASGVVHIRGLTIDGVGTGLTGIRILSAAEVHIEDCIIRGMRGSPGVGIEIIPTTANTRVFVTNTIIAANTRGVRATPTGAGTVQVLLDDVQITDVGVAVSAAANATVRVSNSVIIDANNAFTSSGSGQVVSLGNNAVAGNANAANDNPDSTASLK